MPDWGFSQLNEESKSRDEETLKRIMRQQRIGAQHMIYVFEKQEWEMNQNSGTCSLLPRFSIGWCDHGFIMQHTVFRNHNDPIA